jgi:Sugar (and other) transporter
MEGFRFFYESALRVNDNEDWSVHSLDYGLFKKRLLFFSERRIRLRTLMRESTDGLLAEEDVSGLVGPFGSSQGLTLEPPAYLGYIPLPDSTSTSSSTRSGNTPNNSYTHADSFAGMMMGALDNRMKFRNVMRRLSNSERTEVTLFLSYEMDKVTMFYLAQWSHLTSIFTEQGPSEYLAHEILELLSFCTTNILAIRQILIRYDAFVRTYGGTPMLKWYMKKMSKPHNPNPFRKLLYHEELNALIDSLEREYTGPLADFATRKQIFSEILDRSQQAEFMAARGSAFWKDSILQSMQDVVLLGVGMMEDSRMSLEPTFMKMRGASLTADMSRIADWRKGRNMALSPPDPIPQMTFRQGFALGLNLLSGFFYCMNYYIVEPSSTRYVNALGCSDAMSGLLIGMMPLAALVSAIVYSIWTNKSFRRPFLVSSLLLVVGNLVYSAGYKHGSIWYALIGRFMTGLGAPKCIVRRYMADTTPVALRTSVNAGAFIDTLPNLSSGTISPVCFQHRQVSAWQLPSDLLWVLLLPFWSMAGSSTLTCQYSVPSSSTA